MVKKSEIKTVTTPSADDILRICGDNRYATAAEIAKNTFEKADTVVLAYGTNYADALAGVSLAARNWHSEPAAGRLPKE